MKRIDAIAWCESKLGQALDFDGQYGAQCVDLFNFYFQYLTGRNPYSAGFGVNSAYQLFDVRDGDFDYIVNNPNDANQMPNAGDIMIFNGGLPGSGGHGHVAVFVSGDSSAFTVYEQNWGGMFVKKQTHPWTGYERGWLAFKNFTPDVALNERVVSAGGVNYRTEANTSSSIIETFVSGDVLVVDGWKHSQAVDGNDIWFRGAFRKGWLWSGAFTNTSVGNLPEIKDSVVTPPTPTPKPIAAYPNLVNIKASDVPSWISFETVLDPHYSTPQSYLDDNGYEYNPVEHQAHWWGSPLDNTTHDGTVNYIKNKDDLSTNFVTSANRITYMVDLNNVAWTTGKGNRYGWKNEIDPKLTEDVYVTAGWLVFKVEQLNPKLKDENIKLHKEYMPTDCSRVDVVLVRQIAEQFATGERSEATGKLVEPIPEPIPTPNPNPQPKPPMSFKEFIKAIIKFFSGIFK